MFKKKKRSSSKKIVKKKKLPTSSVVILKKILFILFYLFLAVLGLHCCAWAFSSCGGRGLLFVAVHRRLIAVASLVVEHGL